MSQIVVPQLGESVVEARVARWLKKVGDPVTPGEPVVELETDKIDLEVGADQAGVLARIDRQEGDDVKVGELLAVVEPGDGAGAGAATAAPEESAPGSGLPAPGPFQARAASRQPPAAVSPAASLQPPADGAAADVKATATARRMADNHAVNLAQVPGTGEGGRVTKEDVQRYLAGADPRRRPRLQAPGSRLQGLHRLQPRRPTDPRRNRAARRPPPAARRGAAPSPQPPAPSRLPASQKARRAYGRTRPHVEAPRHDRQAPRGGAAHRRDAHHVQRGGYVGGDGAPRPAEGSVPEAARGQPRVFHRSS